MKLQRFTCFPLFALISGCAGMIHQNVPRSPKIEGTGHGVSIAVPFPVGKASPKRNNEPSHLIAWLGSIGLWYTYTSRVSSTDNFGLSLSPMLLGVTARTDWKHMWESENLELAANPSLTAILGAIGVPSVGAGLSGSVGPHTNASTYQYGGFFFGALKNLPSKDVADIVDERFVGGFAGVASTWRGGTQFSQLDAAANWEDRKGPILWTTASHRESW